MCVFIIQTFTGSERESLPLSPPGVVFMIVFMIQTFTGSEIGLFKYQII